MCGFNFWVSGSIFGLVKATWFRASIFEFRVSDFGFRVCYCELVVSGCGFRHSGLGFRRSGLEPRVRAVVEKVVRFDEKYCQEFLPGSFRWTDRMSRPGTKFLISENVSG